MIVIDRDRYDAWRAALVHDATVIPDVAGIQLVFPGTRVSVANVANALRVAREDGKLETMRAEILRRYPTLTEEDLLFAVAFVLLEGTES